ncbi:Hypothetical predicted protein [Scomber scombrus]|uniref:Uncharacterized protein n=1 Tax=Scomber scombrus TaxID=13677 RepID=A0AAV1NB70_SCOSC
MMITDYVFQVIDEHGSGMRSAQCGRLMKKLSDVSKRRFPSDLDKLNMNGLNIKVP